MPITRFKQLARIFFCLLLNVCGQVWAQSYEDVVVGPLQFVASPPGGGEPQTPPAGTAVAACEAYLGVLTHIACVLDCLSKR
jgi:hypothetical protein